MFMDWIDEFREGIKSVGKDLVRLERNENLKLCDLLFIQERSIKQIFIEYYLK